MRIVFLYSMPCRQGSIRLWLLSRPRQKLSETHSWFYNAKDRLDRLFPFGVEKLLPRLSSFCASFELPHRQMVELVPALWEIFVPESSYVCHGLLGADIWLNTLLHTNQYFSCWNTRHLPVDRSTFPRLAGNEFKAFRAGSISLSLAFWSNMICYNQHWININTCLGIITLLKTTTWQWHNPRFRICEINLVFSIRALLGFCRFFATGFLAAFFSLLREQQAFLHNSRFASASFSAARRSPQLWHQPWLSGAFHGDLILLEYPFRRECLQFAFCKADQTGNSFLDFLFEITSMLPTQRLMLGSIGVHFCAIKRDFSQLENLHLLCNLQDLNKVASSSTKQAFPERRDSIMVWVLICANVTECNGIVSRTLKFPTGKHRLHNLWNSRDKSTADCMLLNLCLNRHP